MHLKLLVTAVACATAMLLAGACLIEFQDYPVGVLDAGAPDASGAGGTPIGASCESDESCGEAACWRGTADAGAEPWPAGGLCTRECSSTSACPAGTECFDFRGRSVCLERCTFGDGDATKCHGRRDVGCAPAQMTADGYQADLCLPICSDDDQCAADAVCDRRTALCATAPSGGTCGPQHSCGTPQGCAPDDCRGLCVGTEVVALCTELCVLGAAPACGQPADSGIVARCLAAHATGAVGDVGSCSCRCNPEDPLCPSNVVACNVMLAGACYCASRAVHGGGGCEP